MAAEERSPVRSRSRSTAKHSGFLSKKWVFVLLASGQFMIAPKYESLPAFDSVVVVVSNTLPPTLNLILSPSCSTPISFDEIEIWGKRS